MGNAAEVKIEDGWINLRETTNLSSAIQLYKRTVNIYEEVWSVIFGKVEIFLHTEKIEFPYNYDSSDMEGIYYDAKCFLTNLKQEISLLKKKADKEKAEKIKRIEELEKALKNLKEQL